MVFSFYVQGVWLEGRSGAQRLEWVRIAVTLAIATGAALFWPLPPAIALSLGVYATVCGLAIGIKNVSPGPRPEFS
jgi:fatty acid desaturase